MKKVLHIFLNAEGTRPWVILFCLLVAALAEAVGIGTLLPALAIMVGQDSGQGNSQIEAIVFQILAATGLSPTFGTLILVVIGSIVIKSIISFGALTYAGITASRVSMHLRRKLVSGIFGASWRFYSGQHGGSFANAISNDATRAGDAYLLAAQFVALTIQAALYSGIALLMDWRLAAIGILVGGIMAAMLNVLIRISRRAGYKQTDRTRLLTVNVVDMLANIKALKTMHRYEPLQASLRNTMQRLQNSLKTREIAKQGLVQGGDAIMAIAIGGVVFIAHTYWQIALPQLIVGGVIFLRVIENVTRLQRILQQAVQVESAYQRLTELIDLTETNSERHLGTKPAETDRDISFENVSFSYGDKTILTNASLTIPAGGITVLKGPSGAGKTTLIDLVIGLHQPSSGRILIGETPLDELDIIGLRRRIGYVPQELSLLHSTVRENITFGDTSITDESVNAALGLAGAASFVASLAHGLDENVGEMGGKLSGGQRQRISLARALASEPDILILDEVTSALDPSTEAEIVAKIRELARQFTIIIITHREVWVEIADRLYDVRDGFVKEVPAAA